MKAPIKDMPPELNRRLDQLDSDTRVETIIKRIREYPMVGRTAPRVDVSENISLGPWQATDTTITLTAQPDDMDTYEFAVQIAGVGMRGWDTKMTHDNEATFMGLRPNTQYVAKVRGIDIFENSTAWSPEIFILTEMDYTPPPVPEGLDLVADGYYVRCKVNEIKLKDEPDFDGFAFYVSQTTGFTPNEDTLKFVGRSNRFVFHAPDVGITYYVSAKSYDVNGNYSEACAEVSVTVPDPRIPIVPSDPGEPGEIVIFEDIEEFDDCDSHLTWTAEVGGIQVATDAETLKEGAGALKISIDKYAPVAENLWYSITNGLPPEIPGTFIIGGPFTKYVVQGFKVGSNCNLKRVGIIVWEEGGSPPGIKVMLYDDDGNGNPDSLLATATFASEDGNQYWRFADFAAAEAIVANTQYHLIFCRSDEGTGDYYEARVGTNRYSDGIFQYGTTIAGLTKDESRDVIFRCFDDTATLNQHFKVTALGGKDISTHENLEYWIKSDKTVVDWLQASMGESALGEQTDNVTPAPITSWGAEAWDISGIATGDRDAIAHFGFKVLDSDPLANPPSADNGMVTIWVDYIRATKEKKVKVKFTDEVVTIYPADTLLVDVGEGWPEIYPEAYLAIEQGTWVWAVTAGGRTNWLWQNTSHADGDEIVYSCFLSKGIYTFWFATYKSDAMGITKIYLDTDLIATFDCYAAAPDAHVLLKQASIVVARSETYTLKVKVDGKNGASTDYYCAIWQMGFKRPVVV